MARRVRQAAGASILEKRRRMLARRKSIGGVVVLTEARAWLAVAAESKELMVETNAATNTFDLFRDGILLCTALSRLLEPGAFPVEAINQQKDFKGAGSQWKKRENIALFLRFCDSHLALPEEKMFTVAELYNMSAPAKVGEAIRSVYESCKARGYLNAQGKALLQAWPDAKTLVKTQGNAALQNEKKGPPANENPTGETSKGKPVRSEKEVNVAEKKTNATATKTSKSAESVLANPKPVTGAGAGGKENEALFEKKNSKSAESVLANPKPVTGAGAGGKENEALSEKKNSNAATTKPSTPPDSLLVNPAHATGTAAERNAHKALPEKNNSKATRTKASSSAESVLANSESAAAPTMQKEETQRSRENNTSGAVDKAGTHSAPTTSGRKGTTSNPGKTYGIDQMQFLEAMKGAQAIFAEDDEYSQKWLKARLQVLQAEAILSAPASGKTADKEKLDKAALVVQKYLKALRSAAHKMGNPTPRAGEVEADEPRCFGLFGKVSAIDPPTIPETPTHMISGAGIVMPAAVCVSCKCSVLLGDVETHQHFCCSN
jgi:hypothetical protein